MESKVIELFKIIVALSLNQSFWIIHSDFELVRISQILYILFLQRKQFLPPCFRHSFCPSIHTTHGFIDPVSFAIEIIYFQFGLSLDHSWQQMIKLGVKEDRGFTCSLLTWGVSVVINTDTSLALASQGWSVKYRLLLKDQPGSSVAPLFYSSFAA